jgi:hypothetical protein
MDNRLSLEELLQIAEAVLETPYEELERRVCIFRAQASLAAPFARVCGADLHTDPIEQAAICAIRLIRSRPFPFRNNRKVGYECMREMVMRSHLLWSRQMEDADDVKETLDLVESGEMADAKFVAWVRERVTA